MVQIASPIASSFTLTKFKCHKIFEGDMLVPVTEMTKQKAVALCRVMSSRWCEMIFFITKSVLDLLHLLQMKTINKDKIISLLYPLFLFIMGLKNHKMK